MGNTVPDQAGTNTDSLANIADMAQLLLRAKNIKEYHSVLTTAGSLTFPNGIAIESGVVVQFKNKGVFDGKWIIQRVTIHLTDGKLMTEIEFRKCLDFTAVPPQNIHLVTQPSIGAPEEE